MTASSLRLRMMIVSALCEAILSVLAQRTIPEHFHAIFPIYCAGPYYFKQSFTPI